MNGKQFSKTANELVRKMEPIWVYNAVHNHEKIMREFNMKNLKPIEKEAKSAGQPAIVFGSAVSGQEILKIKKLIKKEKVTIFASPSNVNYLIKNGIKPAYVVSVDPSPEVGRQMKEIHPSLFQPPSAKLITTMVSDLSTYDNWYGPMLLFRPHQQGNVVTANVLPVMYSKRLNFDTFKPIFDVGILNMGNVCNTALCVAEFLGYDPIIFVGYDLCFGPNGEYSTDRYKWNNTKWKVTSGKEIAVKSMVRKFKDYHTTDEMISYVYAFYILWSLMRKRIYTLSQNTLLDIIPKLDSNTLSKEYHKLESKEYPMDDIMRSVNEFLKENGIFVTKNEDGVQSVSVDQEEGKKSKSQRRRKNIQAKGEK